LVDRIEYPALEKNVSYAINSKNEWIVSQTLTPRLENFPTNAMTASEKLRLHDPRGAVISVIAMSVVFSLLIILFICFKQLAKFHVRTSRKKAAAAHGVDIDNQEIQHVGEETGDIYAAIALAIQLYQDDIHDLEDMVVTIEREDKIYSPWSSKVQTLRQIPTVIKNK
jgi:Na+-transporting methylmalonyl-CoA/oxaloacetate decarboxylase gamma subunit